MSQDTVIDKVERGDRISPADAEALYTQTPLLELGQLAQSVRFRRNPERAVTFAVDRNINYTNICVSRCGFCAFWRPKENGEAYVLDDDLSAKKLEETKALGGTHILFQGGLNPDLDLNWHEDRIRLIRSFGLNCHGYSPPEISFFAEQSGMSLERALDRLIKAGLNSIPGGGAEILSDRVRAGISPAKIKSAEWLHVMSVAHKLGLRTSATMMFGHVETIGERLEHLFLLRDLQDKTGGFTSFIPWPYQPGEHTLRAKPTGAPEYLRMPAISRIILDNFDHIQASWVTQGAAIGQLALSFGADDLGSTMIEENVVAAAGVNHRLSRKDMVRLIEDAGFKAAQRNAIHEPVEVLH